MDTPPESLRMLFFSVNHHKSTRLLKMLSVSVFR